MPEPKKHLLKNVLITRIAAVKNPAVGDSEIVLMKSADDEPQGMSAMLKNFGERLLDMVQSLAKNQPQTTESPDMKIEDLKIEDLEKSRPDLVEAITKKNKSADTDVTKSDPFKKLSDALENLRTEFVAGLKGAVDRVEKLEKTEKPAPVDLTTITKSITDLTAQVTDLAKAKSQRLAHGGEGEEEVKKSAFSGTFKNLRKSAKKE